MIDQNKRNFIKNSIFKISHSILMPKIRKKIKNKFISEKFYLMGTCGKIQIFTEDIKYGKNIIIKALKKIKKIEKLLTKFSPNSEISKINISPFNYQKVSKETLYILKMGNNISILTNGYFDMGMGNILSISEIDKIPFIGKRIKKNNLKSNLIKTFKNKVMLIRKNSMIDLGGIGKGYALDEAMNIIKNSGINHVAIEFGGEIKVNGGMPDGSPWNIKFNKNLKIENLKIKNGSVAISGKYIKKSSLFSSIKNHIINSKNLSSNQDCSIVIVIGEKSIICDALSTACCYMDKTTLCKIKNIFSCYKINVFKK